LNKQEKYETRQQIMTAIVKYAKRLGRAPSWNELAKKIHVKVWVIRRLFGSYTRALKECNLEGRVSGRRLEMQPLFEDWAAVTRKLKRVPSSSEYAYLGKYSEGPLRQRFHGWNNVPKGLKEYVEENGWQEKWKDVLELIAKFKPTESWKTARKRAAMDETAKRPKILDGRLVYGPPMRPCALAYCPTNEAGVLYLFGSVATDMGFMVTHLQSDFPDCEAMRRIEGDKWQPIRIEFEYQSRNFLVHAHDANGCDLIICWEHNWPECPIEVIELKSLVGH
jgi:hypothetical protein